MPTTYRNHQCFKVLTADGSGTNPASGPFRWSLPVVQPDGTVTPGDWHELSGPLRYKMNALHITLFPRQLREAEEFQSRRVFTVEYDGEILTRSQAICLSRGDEATATSDACLPTEALLVRRARLVAELSWDDERLEPAERSALAEGAR